MGVKISDLPAAPAAASAMQFEVNNAGTSQRLTLAQMFALSTGAVVADTPLFNFAQTWNNAGVAFTALKLSITDSASASSSALLDLQVGGTSMFRVLKSGQAQAPNGSSSVPTLANAAGTTGLFFTATPAIGFSVGGFARMTLGATSNQLRLRADGSFAFAQTNDANDAPDVIMVRDAAHTLALRSGGNGQRFYAYNTYTDTSNFEVGFLRWEGNQLQIGTGRSGTGIDRALVLATGFSGRWQVTTTGHFHAVADNIYDIGANNTLRPRTIYLGTSLDCQAGFISWGSGARIRANGGQLRLYGSNAQDSAPLVQFGGVTSSFPALKRDNATLQARLADDSAFAVVQGRLRTDAAAQADGALASTHTLVIEDSNGTAWKVLAVAAA